jgi:hypothetical protein
MSGLFLNWLESSFPEAKSIGSVIANSHPRLEFSERAIPFPLHIVDTAAMRRLSVAARASLHDDGGTRKTRRKPRLPVVA